MSIDSKRVIPPLVKCEKCGATIPYDDEHVDKGLIDLFDLNPPSPYKIPGIVVHRGCGGNIYVLEGDRT